MHGEGRVVEILNEARTDKNFNILDIGCGNGRFLSFLKDKIPAPINYLGIDNNDYFLQESRKKHKNLAFCKFKKVDAFSNIEKIKGSYKAVMLFGLTHHLPQGEFLDTWLKHVASLVSKDGLLFLSFWYPEKTNPGAYLFGWKNKSDTARFVHVFSQKELHRIEMLYKKDLQIYDKFSDGNSKGNYNRYLVFKKL
jgi:ubiquinone/menaquinone biosynthesis C-methylase UbiE